METIILEGGFYGGGGGGGGGEGGVSSLDFFLLPVYVLREGFKAC